MKSRELAKQQPGFYSIISILEPGLEVPTEVSQFSKAFLPLWFLDTEYAREGHIHPTIEHVESALTWSEGKENIVVACHAGISRSSAIAYLIQCKREHHPRLALKVLEPRRHHPNSLIVKHGSEILKEKAVLEEYYKWLTDAMPSW